MKVFKIQNTEHGAVIPIVAVAIFAMVALTGLYIDTSRQELEYTELQTAADSAALAAARQLRGNIDGWRMAKRAAVAALKESLVRVRSIGAAYDEALILDDGIADPRETDAAYESTEGQYGNLSVTVERGWYRTIGSGEDDFEFVSLEETDSYPALGGRPMDDNRDLGVSAHLVANAVQVTLSLDSFRMTFANTFGISERTDFARSATAVNDSALERCVFPVAVTACSLLADLNSDRVADDGGKYQLDEYDKQVACQREVLATEVDPYGIDLNEPITAVRESRIDGLVRAESYHRLPYQELSGSRTTVCFPNDEVSGEQLNCLAVPNRGIIGLPSNENIDPSGTATLVRGEAADSAGVVSALRSGCVPARIGAAFQPLEDPTGLFQAAELDASFRQSLAGSINNSGIPLVEVMGDSLVAENDFNSRTSMQYPNVRTFQSTVIPITEVAMDNAVVQTMASDDEETRRTRRRSRELARELQSVADELLTSGGERDGQSELRLQWPVEDGETESFLMDNLILEGEYEGNFANPMCHEELIENWDTPDARAREVLIMVVSTNPSENGLPYGYCDTASMLAEERPDSFAPVAGTKPVIVGFKKAFLFDFNIVSLEQARWAGDSGNQYGSPRFERPEHPAITLEERDPLLANNPRQLDPVSDSQIVGGYVNTMKKLVEDHLRWVECAEHCDSGSGAPTCVDCTRLAEDMAEDSDDLESITATTDQPPECFDPPSPDLLLTLRGLVPTPPGRSNDFITGWRVDESALHGATRRYPDQGSPNERPCLLEADRAGRYDCPPGRCGSFMRMVDGYLDANGLQATYEWLRDNYCPNAMETIGGLYPPRIDYEALRSDDEDDPGLYTEIDSMIDDYGLAKEDAHCLPRKLDNSWAAVSPAERWEQPKRRKSGWGCGGFRLRMSCSDEEETITSPQPVGKMVAGLVD